MEKGPAARKASGVIRWENPPPHGNRLRRQPSKYDAITAALRARPKRWAVVAEGLTIGSAGSLAVRIRRGRGPWEPAGAFEARQVGPAGSSEGLVYARYVGVGDPS